MPVCLWQVEVQEKDFRAGSIWRFSYALKILLHLPPVSYDMQLINNRMCPKGFVDQEHVGVIVLRK